MIEHSTKPLEELRKIRIEKLQKLKDLGVNPYVSAVPDRIAIAHAKKEKEKPEVFVAGRLISFRSHGKIVFADLRDESGQIQLAFKKDALEKKLWDLLPFLDMGDFIWVSGENFITKAGELTILVKDFKLLTKSIRPLPSIWYGFKDEEARYRQRYVDLILNDEVKEVFVKRTKIIKFLREFMDKNEFLEVETPVLQPIYGGASAKPFITHHNALDTDLYLRISDELYLKRLVAGGFEKVYEIGKVFRNEGIDRSHNPEFTMMEFYWAYANYEDLILYSEEMFSYVIKGLYNSTVVKNGKEELNFTPPWPRETFRDLLLKNTSFDVDVVTSEETLREKIKKSKLKIDIKDVVGYGPLCDKLYKEFVRPTIIQPTLILDYPSEMIALAKRKENDQRRIASFQLVAKGYELIKAYNELNDPIDQKQRWEDEEKLGKRGFAESMMLDEDYIRALEYGMPPTAGWGLGIDRFVVILTGKNSLKETILFPTLRPEGVARPKIALSSGGPKVVGRELSREDALNLIKEHVKEKNIIKHMFAVEALMAGIYEVLERRGLSSVKLGGTKEEWKLAGLLHDGDYCDRVPENMQGVQVTRWAREKGFELPENVAYAMAAHNWENTGIEPKTLMDWALFIGDSLTGFIVATALVTPSKKLSDVTVESVYKKFKQKSFAAGTRRKDIALCQEKLDISLEDFISISLKSMRNIAEELGL